MKTKTALAATLVAASLFAATAQPADAFCGFYVGGAGAKLFNDATQVALMREGTRTVLSMQNTYKGPPEKFAMVVPVPVVLSEDNVKTLKRELFDHLDQLSSPRLVEYWEQDPCGQQIDPNMNMPSGGMMKRYAPTAVADTAGHYGVTVEAQFTVGEYQIVILSAKDSTGLEGWLHAEHYTIPEGAEPYFRPYVASGSKFFVAKVDPQKVKMVDGVAELSPLRFHYDSDELRLPVRLGLINSSGTQDLIVHILGRGTRYEVANYPNVTIPTNLDVAEAARDNFGSFYASLFDRTIEKNPKAVVTEYAWEPTSCDPCPGPAMDMSDLTSLGGDVLPSSQPMPTQPGQDPSDCTTPYWYDAQGVKRYKPQCLGGNPVVQPQLSAQPNGKANAKPTPIFNAWTSAGSMVLTRLHIRYSKESLGEDLVFKAAPAIVGGREQMGMNGGLEHGATPSGSNNFQARYAVRHPWTGPIDCKEPHRGVWGGKPGNANEKPAPLAAKKLGLVARTKTDLASYVKGDIPELGLTRSSSSSPSQPSTSSTPSTSPTEPSAKKGCAGCAITDHDDRFGLAALASTVALTLTLRARRKQRSDRRDRKSSPSSSR